MGSRRARHRKRSFDHGRPPRGARPPAEELEEHLVTCPRCGRVLELSEAHRGVQDLEGRVVNPNVLLCPYCHERLSFGRHRDR
jgi:transcription initiation factor IIE alpha subunit